MGNSVKKMGYTGKQVAEIAQKYSDLSSSIGILRSLNRDRFSEKEYKEMKEGCLKPIDFFKKLPLDLQRLLKISELEEKIRTATLLPGDRSFF